MAKITKEKFKVYENVFDQFTLRNLFKLSSQGHFHEISSPVALGKEANVFTAVKEDETHVIVKIYRLETCNFNKMFDYIRTDPRYADLQHQRRKIIFSWTQREFRNLLKARQAGVNVPTPYTFKDNILVMEMIGKDAPAPPLKDAVPEDIEGFYALMIESMRKLHSIGLVHADLSKFNILNDFETPYLIDFSQATTSDTYNYDELLRRDSRNVATFFSKQGLDVTEEKIYQSVIESQKL